jgi:hypothetical protein
MPQGAAHHVPLTAAADAAAGVPLRQPPTPPADACAACVRLRQTDAPPTTPGDAPMALHDPGLPACATGLRAELAAAHARIAALEAEVARLRRRGRQRNPAGLAGMGEQIHRWKLGGFIWYAIARRLRRSPRWCQKVYAGWKKVHCAPLQRCANAPAGRGRSMGVEEERSDPP